ncbi:MAG: peptidoglycan-binding protein, partial [Alphaproteobacteria bacterium]
MNSDKRNSLRSMPARFGTRRLVLVPIVLFIAISVAGAGIVVAQTTELDIRAVQQELSNRGFDPGPVDGLMGPRTRSAISGFQRSVGLAATEQLDAKTLEALLGAASAPPAPPVDIAPIKPDAKMAERSLPAPLSEPAHLSNEQAPGVPAPAPQASSPGSGKSDAHAIWYVGAAIIAFLVWRMAKRRSIGKALAWRLPVAAWSAVAGATAKAIGQAASLAALPWRLTVAAWSAVAGATVKAIGGAASLAALAWRLPVAAWSAVAGA